MIAFGCSIHGWHDRPTPKPEVYERCAERGLRLAAEPDSVVYANAASGSIARSYNLMLEKAAALEELEALVLLHQDAEIVDPAFCRKLRSALSDPQVGVVGCVGAIGVRSIAWWEGSVTWASFVDRYGEPDAQPPALSWNDDQLSPFARTGEVDAVDGFVLALSPWTVRNVRFDESLASLHGHDVDLCLQVRAAGRTVMAEDLQVVHHHPLILVTDPESWIEAHMTVAEKWDGALPNGAQEQGYWKQRARRAEAEAGAARLQGASKLLEAYARAAEHERSFKELTQTGSWRMTRPLRELNLRRKARRRSRA